MSGSLANWATGIETARGSEETIRQMSAGAHGELEPAYVLHRRPYRETSALLEIFTRAHGRIALVARGARRPRSVLRAALTPFAPLLLSWSGRGEVGTLRAAERQHQPVTFGGEMLLSGLYLNELLMRLTHRHDPHPELFDAYAKALRALEDAMDAELTLRVFEKRMLEAIGYGMLLDREAESGLPVVREQRYAYRADRGPDPAAAHRGDGVEVSGATLLALANEQPLDEAGRREAKRLMRCVLRLHLGDRPLASRAMFGA